MCARMASVDAKLMLTGSCSLNRSGSFPSVSIHSSRNIAVLVYESSFGKGLNYSVGEVKKKNFFTEWHPSERYESERGGATPSVALIEVQDELYVIETHCSFRYLGRRSGEVYYMMGKVDTTNFKIKWEEEEILCTGYKPKVCVKDDGTVIIACEQVGNYDLLYNIGKISMPTKVEWKNRGSTIPEVSGVTPDVAIHNNNIIFIYRHRSTLEYKMGTLKSNESKESNESISWLNEGSLEMQGTVPSISINRDGLVTIYYQYPLWGMYYLVGKLERSGNEIKLKHQDALSFSKGDYPSIALADDGHALLIYKSWVDLFVSHGKLHLPEHE